MSVERLPRDTRGQEPVQHRHHHQRPARHQRQVTSVLASVFSQGHDQPHPQSHPRHRQDRPDTGSTMATITRTGDTIHPRSNTSRKPRVAAPPVTALQPGYAAGAGAPGPRPLLDPLHQLRRRGRRRAIRQLCEQRHEHPRRQRRRIDTKIRIRDRGSRSSCTHRRSLTRSGFIDRPTSPRPRQKATVAVLRTGTANGGPCRVGGGLLGRDPPAAAGSMARSTHDRSRGRGTHRPVASAPRLEPGRPGRAGGTVGIVAVAGRAGPAPRRQPGRTA